MSDSRDLERNTLDGRDLVTAVHTRSLRELEQLARAERARVLGNFISVLFRRVARKIADAARESKLQLAAEAVVYSIRRNSGRPLR
jgi:hypothetical protein